MMAENLLLGTDRYIRLESDLACYIGLNESIVLQKLHRLLGIDSMGQRDDIGVKWIRMTIEEWCKELPFFDSGQIKRTLKNLSDDGLVSVKQFNGRSNWYTIKYTTVDKLDGPVDRLQKKFQARRGALSNAAEGKHNVLEQNVPMEQNVPIHQNKMYQCIGTKCSASNSPSNAPSNSSTNAGAQEPDGLPEGLTKPGPLTTAVLDICKQDFTFVSSHKFLRIDLLAAVELLDRKAASPASVLDFEQWRKSHHWSGNTPPKISQVGEFWGAYEDWVNNGRPEPQKGNKGTKNGHTAKPVKRQRLDEKPYYDPFTNGGEYVYPDGRRVPAAEWAG